jgi:transaldolase
MDRNFVRGACGEGERRAAAVASFFVSRVDTEVDRRLDKIGTEQSVATDRWKALERAGARPQRTLWASTSLKDPAYDDTRYVTDLIAPGVINTMPEATLNAVADHGDIPDDSIHGTYHRSLAVLDNLAALGIDYA